MRKIFMSWLVVATAGSMAGAAIQPAQGADPGPGVERGRYLTQIAGCNDCHTAGYFETGGAVPEEDWLTGSPLGWQGPWGTTYAINLRMYFASIEEDQWVSTAHALRSRPPMPWFALRDMTEDDLRSIWRFVRSLGPAGTPAPEYRAPGVEVTPPYVRWEVPAD